MAFKTHINPLQGNRKVDDEEDCDKITFLYKFIMGECPRSFGMNVARMAGLPDIVIKNAKLKAKEFSQRMAEMLKQQPPVPAVIQAPQQKELRE